MNGVRPTQPQQNAASNKQSWCVGSGATGAHPSRSIPASKQQPMQRWLFFTPNPHLHGGRLHQASRDGALHLVGCKPTGWREQGAETMSAARLRRHLHRSSGSSGSSSSRLAALYMSSVRDRKQTKRVPHPSRQEPPACRTPAGRRSGRPPACCGAA